MRIAQLRCFSTIAQLENVSQAAEHLHLSQSSLSKNLATLEEELGAPLFERNKSIFFTPDEIDLEQLLGADGSSRIIADVSGGFHK